MRILITGGAGFIGSNLTARGIRLGVDVTVMDNLARSGTTSNLEWLGSLGRFTFIKGDLRDPAVSRDLCRSTRFDAVFHEAAQVAVTTSVSDPRTDFEVNALGTLNLLEAIRLSGQNPVFIYASTNKVYGSLRWLELVEQADSYAAPALSRGIAETVPLDFHSPYGCSKGAADQYVIDYRRTYGLRTIVFRQSCIYGTRQMGTEDQAWIAWMSLCALSGRPITVYGDGKQVRDVLHIDDLVDLYFRAADMEPGLSAFVFNVGGGPAYSISVLRLLSMLESHLGRPVDRRFSDWRPGDQRLYVSDITRLHEALGWSPKISPEQGLDALLKWVDGIRNGSILAH
jgi:CDP-paratose 2-epimerase